MVWGVHYKNSLMGLLNRKVKAVCIHKLLLHHIISLLKKSKNNNYSWELEGGSGCYLVFVEGLEFLSPLIYLLFHEKMSETKKKRNYILTIDGVATSSNIVNK